MNYTTNLAVRHDFITGLRDLANYLARNPGVPVPAGGIDVTVHADSDEDGGLLQVDHVARLMGVRVTDETAHGGHYTATRLFGPVGYTVVSIPVICMERHHALMSYHGHVAPDGNTPSPDV